jgi:arginine/ornithine N-succinyltransferase beta subunit
MNKKFIWDLLEKYPTVFKDMPLEQRAAVGEMLKDQLDKYTLFLLKNGYTDSDVIDEPPTPIDQYLNPKE